MFPRGRALFILILGIALLRPALVQAQPTLTIMPATVTSTDPVDISITASFPKGLPFVADPRATFNGRDISQDILPILGENFVDLTPPEPAIPTGAALALDGIRFPAGLQGDFVLSFKEDGVEVNATLSVDIPLPVGIVELTPTGLPGASGSALVAILASGNELDVTVTVFGLAANTTHANAIHRGFCPPANPEDVDQQGPAVITLTDLSVGADGSGIQTTTVMIGDANVLDAELTSFLELLNNTYYLNVREDQGVASPSQTCGALQYPAPELQSDALLNPSSDGDALGTASNIVTSLGPALGPFDVHFITNITIGGLAPDSLNVTHIHGGVCPDAGVPETDAVVTGLNDLMAGGDGFGRQLTILNIGQFGTPEGLTAFLDSLTMSDFYLTVHPATPGSGEVLSCGNIVLNRQFSG